MRYIHDTTNFNIESNTVVALGNFDGIHRGHRKLINTCIDFANKKNLKSVVFSFYPHPSHVLDNLEPVSLIYTKEEKRLLIDSISIDYYIEYPFTKESSKLSAIDFISKILVKQLNVKAIIVGSNYRFGYKRQGDIKLLKELSGVYGYEVIVIDNIEVNNKLVSSTYIRNLIKDGKIEEVNNLLIEPYFIKGIVSKGRQLGRTIGFPTINFTPNVHKQYPPNGVYVTKTIIDKEEYFSVTNIGYNPTISSKNKKTIETFILDFNNDLYGQDIVVQFLSRIRKEISFPSLDKLIEQLNYDVNYARQYYNKGGN